MSFFYLSPAKGDLHIHLLEVILSKRLEHLNLILNKRDLQYNEYVIEGSVYDNVGHFLLCLVTVLEQSVDFSSFVLKTEVALFKSRLESLSSYQLRCFAKKVLRIIRKGEINTELLEPLQFITQYLSLKNYAHHISSECNSNCCSHFLHLQFSYCLEFISRRDIEIHKGIAHLPCGKWKEYIICLFRKNLMRRLNSTQIDNLTCDPRISEILKNFRKSVSLWKVPVPNILTSQNVDKNVHFFPPCMMNLHLQLRKRHRLSHEQRFNYSLFLKDIGMPLNESVEFWKSEYIKASDGHNCCHSWTKDEKKFLYGIRHMYGMEGGRKSYSCRNCHQIQEIQNVSSEGGCPFKSFDNLDGLLHLEKSDMSQIFNLINNKKYTKACIFYLQNSHKNPIDCEKLEISFSPVKYFMLASMK